MANYYYDRLRAQILPRNADVNLLIGARGLGKTYGVRRYMLEDYIKNGICFVEVTRYREENNDVAAKYFDRIIEDNIFPDWEFRVHNKVAEARRTGDKEWKTCGYFIPLSLQQQKKKSTYVNVRNICMDEIIIDPDDIYHHYLRNEYEQLANLVDTAPTITSFANREYSCWVTRATRITRISNITVYLWSLNLVCNGWTVKRVCLIM